VSSLRDPDTRRAVRAIVQAVLALALIGLLYWIVGRVDSKSPLLNVVVRGTLIILGLGEVFYGAENVTRAITLKAPGGAELEFGNNDKSTNGEPQ
jgi:hypothetical protein